MREPTYFDLREKLKIGDTFYLIYKNNVFEEKVFMIGEDEFIHENAFNPNCCEDYRMPIDLYDEGYVWFRDFNELKTFLQKHNRKLELIEKGFWSISDDIKDN